TTGKMVSQPFAIERRFIKFLVGGGSSRNTQIRLVVDGRTVRAASGRNDERLLPAFWDVRDLQGRQAHIEIVDNATGGWGHINVDQIEFGDLPGSVETLELLDEILPARFAAVRPVPAAAGAPEHVTFQGLAPRTGAAEQRSKSGRAAVAGSLGAGRVILDAGPILDPDHIELVGARAAAYRALASTVGAQIKGGEGVPAGAPGMGSVAIGVKGGSQGFDLAFTDWTAAWSKFAGAGLKPATEADPMLISHPTAMGRTCCGAVGTEITVAPGKTVETPFVVAWRYPNKYSSRGENMGCHYAPRGDQDNAGLIARRAIMRFAALRSRTERFRSVFYDSSLPHWMLDAITSQVATLRHIGVVFRIGNGDFYGWEGSNGCCDPTCTHVWGYVQNAARVFPAIERDMRRIDFKHQQGPDGGVHNRTEVPSPPRPTGERPFTDGHCSCILKAYREALNTEGDAFFKEYWPNVRHAVQYMIDRDAATSNGTPNGLIEDDQWNTYDEALHGVTSFIGTYYLAALRAGEEWAKRAGDRDSAARFRSVYELGRKNLVDRCWNGEYFRQDLPGYEKRGGEVGPGCMADQLIGQWWAHQLGLGYLLPEDKVKAALAAVFKYNWMPDLTGWRHSPRAFAGASDKGLIICTWPKGGRPPNVMLYSDEVWTGVEYQVAAHMLYEGMIEEGFAIVKGVRDRYDGVPRAPIPRNPWNEIECGGHYARAGSSWSLLLAASGWRYDGERRELELKPRTTPAAFKAMFTGPEAWGSVVQSRKGGAQRNELTVVEGRLEIASLKLAATGGAGQVKVALGAQAVTTKTSASGAEVVLQFASPVTIVAGQTLTVKVS
ncbi:MAG TPA: GH116 family glycosyl hydrolase, partial [Chthonomonadaceae bacterium]|nr:GH116 family glycosyl hydrolase [Chthonomonadaceae bacterium]